MTHVKYAMNEVNRCGYGNMVTVTEKGYIVLDRENLSPYFERELNNNNYTENRS